MPNNGSPTWYGALARRATMPWAVALVGGYFFALQIWIRPHIIKWAFPWLGSTTVPHLPHFLLSVLLLALAMAVTVAAGYGAGRPLARWLRLPAGAVGRDVALGWGALSPLLLGLGLAGCWQKVILAAAVLPAAAYGALALARDWKPTGDISGPLKSPAFAVPAALMAWLLLLILLAPEVFQDGMRYHLFFPRRFLLEHKFIFVERYFFWSYMGLPHMLYTAGMALGGDRAVHAINACLGLASLAAVARLARLAGLPPVLRALALGLTVTAPGLMLITGATFAEHGAFLYVLLALETALAERRSPFGRLREALLLSGMAFSAKHTAVFGLAGYAVLVLARPDRDEWLVSLKRRAAAACACFGAPVFAWWLVRWLWTGDPLSPHLAKFGFPTLDSSSLVELGAYYEFTGFAHRSWIASPDRLFYIPVQFMGAHAGFWEHPGPAIPALLLGAFAYFSRAAAPARLLLAFTAGSAGMWILLFGGLSPHYVVGMAGVWTVGLLGIIPAMEPGKQMLARNLLAFTVMGQTLLSLSAGIIRFGPRDYAFGTVDREYYLTRGLQPSNVHHPIRKDLETAAPGRGKVYVLGDDTSYYLSGRVFVDYESGSDPLLWRLADESASPARLRVKLRQRGFTHAIYSTQWPDENSFGHREEFRFGPRTARLMQDFWRGYAEPIALREEPDLDRLNAAIAFRLREAPTGAPYRASLGNRLPLLPGAGLLTWGADKAYRAGKLAEAERILLEWEDRLGPLVVLDDRLARLAQAEGRRAEAMRRLKRVHDAGWDVSIPGLTGR